MKELWARPFEGFMALLVLVVGLTQSLLSLGYPPEMAVVPGWGLRVYGVYVLVGSFFWLLSIVRASMVMERAALTALSGAFFLIVGVELYFASASVGMPGLGVGLAETVVWQIGLGVGAVARATYLARVIRVSRL